MTMCSCAADDPADALTLAGGSLAHTDWMPDNVLIAEGRAWLVDWAWPTLAAAWIDPASWLLRIMARGHTPAEAEAHAARLPAYATADPTHIDIFVRANVRMWNEIEQTNGRPWARIMAHTARTWAQHRSIGVLSLLSSRRSPVGSGRAL
jgi:thiamine kinase-like enzyme